jgi:hypothetical protein
MTDAHDVTFLEPGFRARTRNYESVSRTSNKLYLEGGFGAFLFK